MTWTHLHQQTAFMADVIGRAAEDIDATWQFIGEQQREIERLFGNEDGFLLALQHRWTTMLTAELDQADYADIPTGHALAALGARHPGLRALLDGGARRSVRLRALQREDDRIVALFGGAQSAASTGA